MALSTTTRQTWHAGDGVTTVYPYAFEIAADSELEVVTRVITTGVETTLVLTTDYTVSGEGVATGGNVTLVTALPATKQMTIRGKLPLTQTTSLNNQGAYYAKTHENAFDRRVGVDQQQQHEINRCLKLPVSINPSTYDPELPVPSADKVIGWNAAGTALENKTEIDVTSVSAFAETLLDDADAEDLLKTISDVLTTETDPALTDLIPYYDASSTAGRQITTPNLLKIVTSLTEDTAPALADQLLTYDASAAAAKKVLLGSIAAGALKAGWFGNLGLVNATTTVTNDSIQIQGASATLSATNPLYINLPHHSSPGLTTRLSAIADVKMKVTGAHWGLGTLGDFNRVELRVYAINDAGTLKWGVSNQGGYRTITTALSSATQTDITSQTKMLVTSTLTGTSPCLEVGWFVANFDDTGGVAEDLWALQTSVGDINVGIPVPVFVDPRSETVTGAWSTNTTYTAFISRERDFMVMDVLALIANGAPTSAVLTVNIPTFNGATCVLDTSKKANSTNAHQWFGTGVARDEGTKSWRTFVRYTSTTAVEIAYELADGDLGQVTQAAPFTFTATDRVTFLAKIPIRGWSSN